MDQAIDNRKTALSAAILSTLRKEKKHLVNLGPLTKTFKRLMLTYPKMNAAYEA